MFIVYAHSTHVSIAISHRWVCRVWIELNFTINGPIWVTIMAPASLRWSNEQRQYH